MEGDVAGSADLKKINLSIELNDSREFVPHLVPSHRDDMNGKLTIGPNMLTLGTEREVVVLYKTLFGAILTTSLVRDLAIEMEGVLSSLVGALVVAVKVPRRAFDHLTIRLGNDVTFKRGKSLYWEVYGHPFHRIVNLVKGTLPTGRVVLVLPPEYWGDLSQRGHLLNGINAEGKRST